MTFIRKFNGKTERTNHKDRIVAVYCCPEHGEFDAEVMRNENGEAPDLVIGCGVINDDCSGCGGQPSAPGASPCLVCDGKAYAPCARECRWTPTPIAARVRRVEAVKGGWEKPERKTYLDTRRLGEGQDIDDFRAERAAVWEEKRKAEVMAIKKGFE